MKVGECASGWVGEPAPMQVGVPASGQVGVCASGQVGVSASGEIRARLRFPYRKPKNALSAALRKGPGTTKHELRSSGTPQPALKLADPVREIPACHVTHKEERDV